MKWKSTDSYKIEKRDGAAGEEVIVFSWGSRKTFIARGRMTGEILCFVDPEGYWDPRVAHWMPLPKIPESDK